MFNYYDSSTINVTRSSEGNPDARNVPHQSSSSDMADDPASDEMRLIFQWICYTVLGQSMACFGIVTNIMNIVCFIKQGFKDPVNISLLGNVCKHRIVYLYFLRLGCEADYTNLTSCC